MNKGILMFAALSGALAVMLGAFGAHGLSAHLNESQMQTFQTGNRYHFYHTLACLVAVLISSKYPEKLLRWSGSAFLIGILFFSGSLYLLATRHLLGIESWTFLGPITPIGGLFFILGWIMLLIGAIKFKD